MSLSRSILTLSFFLALAGGCGDKEDTTDSGGAADGTDAADGADASDGDDGASDGDDDASDGTEGGSDRYDTVEEYIGAYCEAILTRCGVYSSTEICVEDIMGNWYTSDCVVESQENAQECLTFLEGVDCDDRAWIDACDAVVSCD